MKVKSLSSDVRRRARLWSAWRVIQANGAKSQSRETREEVKRFADSAEVSIDRIAGQLRRRTFRFAPAKAVLVTKRNNAGHRGIVMAPVESRIVQRAILDVLQEIPSLAALLDEGFNYGGVAGAGLGVPAAVRRALIAAQSAGYFIRTDIKKFFDKAPRDEALRRVLLHVSDATFSELVREAVAVELSNLTALSEANRKLFPLGPDGVAQGSCLSPLLCNILLSDFDREMNAGDTVCIRYIDDFILFAPDRRAANAALKRARRHLGTLGLEAYSPEVDFHKAEGGKPAESFTFLGCEIRPDRVRPSQQNRTKLRKSVTEVFSQSISALGRRDAGLSRHQTIAGAIVDAGRIVEGWGHTFGFCTDDHLMADIDRELGERLFRFLNDSSRRLERLEPKARAKAYGMTQLTDCQTETGESSCRIALANYRATHPPA